MVMKITLVMLVIFGFFASYVLAEGPLPVFYAEPEDEIEYQEESQQSYIDNQAYLREFERKRRERVLSGGDRAPVAVISRKTEKIRTYGPWNRYYPEYRQGNRFFGIEFQSGNTSIRYYDGYQPNCCGPQTYIIHPPPYKEPPYHRPSGRRSSRP